MTLLGCAVTYIKAVYLVAVTYIKAVYLVTDVDTQINKRLDLWIASLRSQ